MAQTEYIENDHLDEDNAADGGEILLNPRLFKFEIVAREKGEEQSEKKDDGMRQDERRGTLRQSTKRDASWGLWQPHG
jgi:hypothetical protein